MHYFNQHITTCTAGDVPVIWAMNHAGRHTIIYGKQKSHFTGPNSAIEAAYEYGECIVHSLTCAGILDCDTDAQEDTSHV